MNRKEKDLKDEIHNVITENMGDKYGPITVGRAISSSKDGLIEVTRKLMWDVFLNGFYGSNKNTKSAAIVGDVMAKYHPHGDTSIYGNLVQIGQWFSTNYPLISAPTNFGNILGDPAGSFRYTDCRGSKFAQDVIFEDLDSKNVDFQLNFDRTRDEPQYLPTKLPLLLINGAFFGIAVAFAINIPPHNLNDVCERTIRYIRNPRISNEELVDGLYPDYPTGGIITNPDAIERFYKYGEKTSIRIRADYEIDREKNKIIIKSLPFKVYWNRIVEKVCELTSTKNGNKPHPILSKITDFYQKNIRTENENDSIYKFEIVVSKDANILEVVDHLFKSTDLSVAYPMNFISNYDGNVIDVNVKDIISSWYEVRKDVFKRKYISRKNKLEIENHNLEGLISIYPRLKELVDFIRDFGGTKEELVNAIFQEFKPLSRSQISSIVTMHLYQLTKVSKDNLIKTLERNKEEIKEIEYKLGRVDECIIEEIEDLSKRYGRERRSVILKSEKRQAHVVSSGSILYSHSSIGIFGLYDLLKSKTITNGLRSVKINGKNYRKIIGSVEITDELKGIIIFYENGTVKRIPIIDFVHLNSWVEFLNEEDNFIKFVIPFYNEDDKILIASDNKVKISKISEFGTTKRNIGSYSLVKLLENDFDDLILMDNETNYILVEDYKEEIPVVGAKSGGVKTGFKGSIKFALELNKSSDNRIVLTLNDVDLVNQVIKPFSMLSLTEYDFTNKGNRIRKARKLIKDAVPGSVGFIGQIDLGEKNTQGLFINSDGTLKMDLKNFKNDSKFIMFDAKGLVQIEKF